MVPPMAPRNSASLLAKALVVLLGALLFGCGAAYLVGTLASAPARVSVGTPPADLPTEAVAFASESGSRLSGWFIPGQAHAGAVLLMHGIRANRLEMLGRARFLHGHGLAVLLFDFQAHGDSPGQHITFGYLEALDARAAFAFLRSKTPAERIAVIGLSLGGAAAILAELQPDAMVLEAVYANFGQAVENRLAMRLGSLGRYFGPVLTWQVKPRLGFDPSVLQPAERIARLHAPVLLVAGDADRHATLSEMRLLYERAREPKELRTIPGAQHVDFHRHSPGAYERKILEFLSPRLKSPPG
jgi:fermentation-respiration switch protein FrsA (DUF1100 family)